MTRLVVDMAAIGQTSLLILEGVLDAIVSHFNLLEGIFWIVFGLYLALTARRPSHRMMKLLGSITLIAFAFPTSSS